MNLVAPFGFYGWGNIGDESTLQGFAQLVSRYDHGIRVWVASRNPSHTARVEPSFKYYKAVGRDPRRWWARHHSVACVVAGGTPIMDVLGSWPLAEVALLVQALHKQGKPVAFVGTGTEKLQREESKRVVSDIIAPRVLHWSVRCERDKERLTEYGVAPDRVTVAADLAWMLEAVPTDFGRQYLRQLGLDIDGLFVGVNVNNERFMLEQEPRFFEKVGKFLDRLVEKYGVRILFLCNEVREGETYDKAASLKVLACMGQREKTFLVPNEYWTPQQMLSLIGCCRVTVSTRYHFCLFSTLQGVPFLSLNRSDKVADLCSDMNWPYGASLNDLSVLTLVEMFSDIEVKRSRWIGYLQEQVKRMRVRTSNNHAALDSLLRQVEQ